MKERVGQHSLLAPFVFAGDDVFPLRQSTFASKPFLQRRATVTGAGARRHVAQTPQATAASRPRGAAPCNLAARDAASRSAFRLRGSSFYDSQRGGGAQRTPLTPPHATSPIDGDAGRMESTRRPSDRHGAQWRRPSRRHHAGVPRVTTTTIGRPFVKSAAG
ncbi:unnamed protein product [Lampetra planeri]